MTIFRLHSCFKFPKSDLIFLLGVFLPDRFWLAFLTEFLTLIKKIIILSSAHHIEKGISPFIVFIKIMEVFETVNLANLG